MSTSDPDADPMLVGYKQPPVSTRFPKGRSGNPKGRPKARHRELPYDAVLGQMVTIREDSRERRVTAAEAFLLQLTRKGLQGDGAAARASLAAIETARESRYPAGTSQVLRIVVITYGIGTVLRTLGLGIKRNPLDKHRVRWEIQPWVVEAALQRFEDRILTHDEQREVWSTTRKPDSVKWPEWWVFYGSPNP